MPVDRQCRATVFGARVQSWRCVRNGSVQREGKWFCKQHDPDRNKPAADAEVVWLWNRWDDAPKSARVVRRTEKTLTVAHSFTEMLRIKDEGVKWFTTELAAWQWRVDNRTEALNAARAQVEEVEAEWRDAIVMRNSLTPKEEAV